MANNFLDNLEWRYDNIIDYKSALNAMESRVEAIIKGEEKSLLWILEHPPIYTAGISTKNEDMIDCNHNIPIFKINRGGKYTYHCPKMKICYLIFDLKKFFYPKSPDIASFVKFIEEWIIAILYNFQINGEIRKDRVGIWCVNDNNINGASSISENKIAAIGIKVKKWVSYHGVAINIDPDFAGFKNIIPCGISQFGITSIAKIYQENQRFFDYQEIEDKFLKYLKQEFITKFKKNYNND